MRVVDLLAGPVLVAAAACDGIDVNDPGPLGTTYQPCNTTGSLCMVGREIVEITSIEMS